MNEDEKDQLISLLLDGAKGLNDEEREAYLNHHCPPDCDELRIEVCRLLDAYERAPVDNLESRLFAEGSDASSIMKLADPLIGSVIGHFRIEERIAAGGFGVVYLARRFEPYRQRVAIKVMQATKTASSEAIQRFQLEQQLMSSLDHENIAKIVDGGIADDGRPYLAMEYVDGKPIDEFCRDHALDVKQRIELFENVCRAVAYVNRHGIIHRDLKPSNILVREDGTPKLLDFGIAKVFTPLPDVSVVPVTEGQLSTPMSRLFASPEQIRYEPVSTASDVYTLGVLLYQLLTGVNPHLLTAKSDRVRDVEEAICHLQPPKPSRARQPAPVPRSPFVNDAPPKEARLGPGPVEFDQLFPSDLDLIVMMAIRKEPQHRYENANSLLEDIGRYRKHLPVAARKSTPAYLAKKFVRRHFLGAALTTIVAISLASGFLATIQGRKDAEHAARLSQQSRSHAEFSDYISRVQLAYSHWLAREFALMRETLAPLSEHANYPYTHWELKHLEGLVTQPPRFLSTDQAISHLALTQDREEVLVGHADGSLSIWKCADTLERTTKHHGHEGAVVKAAWHPSGDRIVTYGRDQMIFLRQRSDLSPLAQLPVSFRAQGWLMRNFGAEADEFDNRYDVFWNPDGTQLATTAILHKIGKQREEFHGVTILDGNTLEPVRQLATDTWVYSGAWLEKGNRIITVSMFGELFEVDLATEECEKKLNLGGVITSLAANEQSGLLAVLTFEWETRDSRLSIVDTNDWKIVHSAPCGNFATDVSWAESGDRVVLSTAGGFLALWEPPNSDAKKPPDPQWKTTRWQLCALPLSSVAFDGQGDRILTGREDGLLCRFALPREEERVFSCIGRAAWNNASERFAAPDASRDVVPNATGEIVSVFNADGQRQFSLDCGERGWVSDLCWGPNDDVLFASISARGLEKAGALVRLEPETGRRVIRKEIERPWSIAANPKDGRVATAERRNVVIRDSNLEQIKVLSPDGQSNVNGVEWSPTGNLIAALSSRQILKIWSSDHFEVQAEVTVRRQGEARDAGQCPLAWHPENPKIVFADRDGRLNEYNVSTGEFRRSVTGHAGEIWTVTYDPTGSRIASGGTDKRVIIWDAHSLTPILRLENDAPIGFAAWSPDGVSLLSQCKERNGGTLSRTSNSAYKTP